MCACYVITHIHYQHQKVQAQDETHAWICPVDETVLKQGCVKFKKRKIEIAVSCLVVMNK